MRSGFSDCADRTRPHTAACTGSPAAGSSPAATAPRVTSTRRGARSLASHHLSSRSTSARTSRTRAASVPDPAGHGTTTASVSACAPVSAAGAARRAAMSS